MKSALLILGFAAVAGAAEISLTPEGQYISVNGDQQKFREDNWINDGWTEGGSATLHQALGKDATLDFEGRGIIDDGDFKLALDITKNEVGFIRAGFTQYRHYYDATGGYFPLFSTPSFTLPGDHYLDIGNIFVDVGLTLPKAPKITLGYERQYRDGQKSLLEWGAVTEGAETRKIYPSIKDVDEHTDIFKVTLEHEIKGVRLSDQFRFERFETDTRRFDLDSGKSIVVKEEYNHDAFFNTFRMDSYIKDHIYWSLGYLYTTLSGNAGLNLATVPSIDPYDKNWVTRAVDVGTDSHVVNLNAMFGPYRGLTIYAGLQAEKTDSDGFSDALLTTGTATETNLFDTNSDKLSLEETLGLRYTKIPFTTLYAEARLTEQSIDLDESGTTYTRQTDTDVFRQDYRVGFNTAPMRRLTFSGRYRYAHYQNDYDNVIDSEPGYPSFITAQDFTTEEIMAKVTARPFSKLSASLQYQLVATDIKTGTAEILPILPAGSRYSGNYDANIYSASVTLTPTARLYLTGMFSFQDTRTVTLGNQTPEVIEYKGNVYTALGTAGFVLDNKSDITLEYSYSRSDNYTGNPANGLPLGIDYHRHGLMAGISRKLTKNLEARLRYGWYEYVEPSSGGVNNYTAHLGSLACTLRF